MDRQAFIFSTPLARTNCARALVDAPDGSRVEIKGPKRTLPQNSHMWALLTEVAHQLTPFGKLRRNDDDDWQEPELWKHVFLHAFGRETKFLPSLDGKGYVPIPQSSSDLSTPEMRDFIEFIYAEGGHRGVRFASPPPPGLVCNPRDAA